MTVKKTKGAKAGKTQTLEPPSLPDIPGGDLKIEYLWLDAIKPYPNNSRTHTPEQVLAIAKSILEFGFVNPVLIDENQMLIAGHARLEAAKKVGLTQIPTIDVSHVPPDKRPALIIADNELAINGSGWNMDILKSEIEKLIAAEFDLSILHFPDDFLQELLANEPEIPNEAEPQGLPDVCCKDGDVWMMGTSELRIDGNDGCYGFDKAIELWQRLTGRQALLDASGDAYFLVRKKRLGDD